MTLTVSIKNEGNQPSDALVIRKVTASYYEKPNEDGCIGSFDPGGTGQIVIMPGQSAKFWPNCGHFDDFEVIEVKGKH